MISSGEEKAWELLNSLDPAVVCTNAGVSFKMEEHLYVVRSFCWDFSVHPRERSIKSASPEGAEFLKRSAYFFVHSCLFYLIHAKDIPFSGRLVKPANIKGGEMFFRGSHILPLEAVSKKFRDNREGFLRKGTELCGGALSYGDASVRLLPLPRIPATLIFWLGDEEFDERTDLLLDSTCELQLPIDILWSTAMMSVLAML